MNGSQGDRESSRKGFRHDQDPQSTGHKGQSSHLPIVKSSLTKRETVNRGSTNLFAIHTTRIASIDRETEEAVTVAVNGE